MTLLAPAKAQTVRQAQAQATPSITSSGFKPNQDLKLVFLIKDCTLTEFNKFIDTFTNYKRSSFTLITTEVLWGHDNISSKTKRIFTHISDALDE